MDKIYHTKQNKVKGWFLVVFFAKFFSQVRKELSLCHNLKFAKPYIVATFWCELQTWIIRYNSIVRKANDDIKQFYNFIKVLRFLWKLLNV